MMAVETQTVKKLQGQKGLLQMKVGKLQEEVERWKRWREHEPDTVQSLLRCEVLATVSAFKLTLVIERMES